jgi:GR25 family glycosyltransferase involved in LPS biosynthesis
MHTLLASGLPAHVVLEDDFQLASALQAALTPSSASPFLEALNTTLSELPEDWDILYLAADEKRGGKRVSPRARECHSGSGVGTLGAAYTRRAALVALEEAQKGLHNVDHMLDTLTKSGALKAYMCDPPLLLQALERFPSEIVPSRGPLR